MTALSRNLTTLLARGLNDVLPPRFSVRADDGHIELYIDNVWDLTSSIGEIVEDEERTLSERLETAVYSVLNGVQDHICRHLGKPWPSTDDREMAMPGVRADTEAIHLWYGRAESMPTVRIQPIRIADLSPPDVSAPA